MDLTVCFVAVTCCVSNCAITWAQPETYNAIKSQDHTEFHCPNGHAQHYMEKSELEKARDELYKTTYKLRAMTDCAEHKKRRIASLKGIITKMKKRG